MGHDYGKLITQDYTTVFKAANNFSVRLDYLAKEENPTASSLSFFDYSYLKPMETKTLLTQTAHFGSHSNTYFLSPYF